MIDVFQKVLKLHRKPNKLWTGNRGKFCTKAKSTVLEETDSSFYAIKNETKSVIVERFRP